MRSELDQLRQREQDRRGRQILTVAAIAARLEHRLHEPQIGPEELAAGCALAASSLLAAVLCRPEHVPLAAKHLAGTAAEVVTALGFHHPTAPRTIHELTQEAAGLTGLGAAEVALIAHLRSQPEAGTGLLAEQTAAVSEAIGSYGGRVRVLLDTTDMTDRQISQFCSAMVDAGAALIQGGSYHGDRTCMSQIEVMRAATAAPTLLKWTHPVRSIQTMLISIALGVDRFQRRPCRTATRGRQSHRHRTPDSPHSRPGLLAPRALVADRVPNCPSVRERFFAQAVLRVASSFWMMTSSPSGAGV